jgi:ABC-type multidrug transport system ATPase subunit
LGSFAIQADNLRKTYFRENGAPIRAVEDLSLSVPYGQVFDLLGPNGAGKTTLVRILTTLLRATNGRAEVGGYDVERDEQQVRYIISGCIRASWRSISGW